MNNLGVTLVTIDKPGDRESLLEALLSFSYIDNDFDGANGDDFLWDRTKEAGFESNAEYEIDFLAKNRKDATDKQIIQEYFDEWMWHDTYYEAYEWDAAYDKENHISAIALAYATD